ncbi:MAG: M48 family metalloprotease [Gammaproteobacteria bacterium]|nr:M48 family metalloprotease [Gammaproteobacteria bacterium]
MKTFLYTAILALASSAHPPAALADGDYGSVPLRDKEQHLIDTSNELHGYFASQAMVYGDEEVLEVVRRVGRDLAPPPTDDYVEYRFFVLRDPSPNAFALPNGDVYIHTGMLARLRDESQLAGVLAHEINHVAGHHGIVEHRATKKKAITSMVLSGFGGFGDLINIGLHASVYGFSRELEQEADDHAAALLLDSPYDPHALPEIFDILAEDHEGLNPRIPTMWSTHPDSRARARTSREQVAQMPRRPRESDAFELVMHQLRMLTIRDYIQDDYPHTAIALAESVIERYPNEPELLHVLGDAWQAMGGRGPLDADELSNRDKRRNARERHRRTREQRLAEQLETEEGRAAYAANLARAEDTYRRALAIDPDFAPAWRGLGEVDEQLERPRDAAEAYLRYVRLAPDAADRAIVVRRLEALAGKLKAQENASEL